MSLDASFLPGWRRPATLSSTCDVLIEVYADPRSGLAPGRALHGLRCHVIRTPSHRLSCR